MADPFAQGTADILEVMGVSAVYHSPDGEVSCTAVLDYNVEITDGHGTVVEVQIAISVSINEVGIPEAGRTFEIDGKTYRVGPVVARDACMVTVSCS